jgi:hypothetical protein
MIEKLTVGRQRKRRRPVILLTMSEPGLHTDTDHLYFGAIESARAGRIDGRAVEVLLASARKFVAVDLLEDSARFFERLYQILQTALSNGYRPNHNQVEYFKSMIEEYCALLSRMERHERRQVVRAMLADLERSDVT